MAYSVATSTKADPALTGPRRNRPGEPRKLLCRYLRRGVAGQCTAESVTDDNADVILCARHLGAAVNTYRELTAGLDALTTTEEKP